MSSELIALNQNCQFHCFICGGIINDIGYDILETETPIFCTPLADKLAEVIDDKYIVVISKEDKICCSCINIISYLDKIEHEFFATKNKILALLESTYKLACDVIEEENGLNCKQIAFNSDYCSESGISINNIAGECTYAFDETITDNSEYILDENSSSKLLKDSFHENKSMTKNECGPSDKEVLASCERRSGSTDDCIMVSDSIYSTIPSKNKLEQIGFNISNHDSNPTTLLETIQYVEEEPTAVEIPVKNTIYLCDICDIPFPKPYLLSRHKKNHLKNSKKVICPLCNEECFDRLHYMYHRKSKHDILKRLTCSLCNTNFSNNKELKKHLITFHNSKSFQCDSCGDNFKSYNKFSNHKLYAHGKKNCTVCGKHIADSIKLRQHENRHVWIESKKLICDVCGRCFKTPGGLRVHKVSHTGNYKFYCEFCGRGFMSSVILEEHKGVHTKEERYVCDICGRKFVLNSTFHLHKQWHNDPLPFPCNICKKRFKYRSVRSIHIRREHTGENPYKCHYCSAEFMKSISLKKHLTLHTKEFPYNCSICLKGFVQKRNLSRHMSRIHHDLSFIQQPKPCEYKVALRPDEFPSPNT